MELHNADLAPEIRNVSPGKNHDFLAQAMLMERNPAGGEEWVERYAEKFRNLFKTEDGFRDLVNSNLTDENLSRIQEWLDGNLR